MPEPTEPTRAEPQSGQAAVETALVLPLFVFLLLGILQLGLMHHARLLTKYAAYKAVRAGALHSASMGKMERAALAVLLPLVSRDNGGGEYIQATYGPGDFNTKWDWPQVRGNKMDEVDLPYVQVTICGPDQKDFPAAREVNFDAPAMTASGNWREGQRTKLRIQVTFNYRMPIPFANWVIFNASRHREVPWLLRMGKSTSKERGFHDARGGDPYRELSEHGVYAQPIRATYTMRMQSNLYPRRPGYELPGSNQCVFLFNYDGKN
jgi:hypothetical protein